MKVSFPGALIHPSRGAGEVAETVSGLTLGAVVSELDGLHPGIKGRIVNEDGGLNPSMAFHVGKGKPITAQSHPGTSWQTEKLDPTHPISIVSKERPPGGIDLNPDIMDFQIKRDGNGVPLPVFQQPIADMKIDGFSPIIINVVPVNVLLLLGLVNQEDEINPSSSSSKRHKNEFYQDPQGKASDELTMVAN